MKKYLLLLIFGAAFNLKTQAQSTLITPSDFSLKSSIPDIDMKGISTIQFRGTRSSGTLTVPTATSNNSDLLQVVGAGHSGSGFTGDRASMKFQASQLWTTSAQGTRIQYSTTANGSTSTLIRMIIENDGNVGIGATTPDFPLHILSTAASSSSTTGALGIGATTGLHLTFDNNQVDAWNNTTGSGFFLNYYSGGTVNIGNSFPLFGGSNADLLVSGYTKLGATAPNIKMKKITGTTDSDANTLVAHGLTKSKILSVSVLINTVADEASGNFYPDHINTAGSTEYRYFVNATDISLSDVGTLLQGKPYRILVTYEE